MERLQWRVFWPRAVAISAASPPTFQLRQLCLAAVVSALTALSAALAVAAPRRSPAPGADSDDTPAALIMTAAIGDGAVAAAAPQWAAAPATSGEQ